MKLIIEKRVWGREDANDREEFYAYFLNESQLQNFKTQKDRDDLKELSSKVLNEECNLARVMPDNSFIIFNLHPLDDFKTFKE